MGPWPMAHGPMGPMGPWAHGTHGPMGPMGPMGPWAQGPWDPWGHGPMDHGDICYWGCIFEVQHMCCCVCCIFRYLLIFWTIPAKHPNRKDLRGPMIAPPVLHERPMSAPMLLSSCFRVFAKINSKMVPLVPPQGAPKMNPCCFRVVIIIVACRSFGSRRRLGVTFPATKGFEGYGSNEGGPCFDESYERHGGPATARQAAGRCRGRCDRPLVDAPTAPPEEGSDCCRGRGGVDAPTAPPAPPEEG